MSSSIADAKFDADVITFLKVTGLKAKRISIQSPWQKRRSGTLGGELPPEILGHVIVLNEEPLRRVVGNYVSYFHDSFEKDPPNRRPIEPKPRGATATVISFPRLVDCTIATDDATRHKTYNHSSFGDGRVRRNGRGLLASPRTQILRS